MKNLLYFLVLVGLCGIAYYLLNRDTSTTISKELSDFSIEDTAQIDQIFIGAKNGNYLKLVKQPNKTWRLNDRYRALDYKVNAILKAMYQVRVKRPVPKAAIQNVIKEMASRALKVEVYSNGENIKTFYCGDATIDSRGTYMYLEGSSLPFITHIPGWEGYITAKYDPNEEAWRDNVIIDYQPNEIASIELEYVDNPTASFKITKNGKEFTLEPRVSSSKQADNQKVTAYLNAFANLKCEGFENKNTALKDSVLNKVKPWLYLRITGTNGVTTQLELRNYGQAGVVVSDNAMIDAITDETDRDMFYNREKDEFGLVQDYSFGSRVYKTFADLTK